MTNQKNGTSWALTVLSNEVILTLVSGEGLQEGLQVVPLRLWNDMEIKELAATAGLWGTRVLRGISFLLLWGSIDGVTRQNG